MLADRMLGKLARLLRMVGHDVEYVREGDRESIARRAEAEGRVLLTRDRRLAGVAPRVVYVQNDYPFHQARQVIRALGLHTDHGFTRCVEDNGRLAEVAVDAVAGRVPPYVLEHQRRFYRCERCERVYWEGTHVHAMKEMIAALEDAPLVRPEAGEDEAPGAELAVLEPLVDLHQAMDVWLLRHRLALMEADLPKALPLMRRFVFCMERHIQDETDWVLPHYAGAAPLEGFERGSAPELFTREHEKILELLRGTLGALEALAVEAAGLEREELRVQCLHLLDREKVLQDLLEHHDLRERRFLYPALERLLSEHEKLDLVERMVGLPIPAGTPAGTPA